MRGSDGRPVLQGFIAQAPSPSFTEGAYAWLFHFSARLAPEAAVALGMSALAGDDDHGLLRKGFMVYDALFAWLRFAADERHNWPAQAA
jgi:hypothetical protein